jgi:hypothetical protein
VDREGARDFGAALGCLLLVGILVLALYLLGSDWL